MLVLGIETSCDDTCAAVVDGHRRVLSSVISSQHDFHRPYRGVVPEVAARQHIRDISPVIKKAFRDARISLSDIDGIAVTTAPGLIGSLLVGVSAAKGFVLGTGLPLIAVNHLLAHVQSLFLNTDDLQFPQVCLLVSGGHTVLFFVPSIGHASVMGSTLDDAAGEAIDKAANLLGLGYPGGPALDGMASEGDSSALQFPRPLAHRDDLQFSFSGLKTSLAVHIKKFGFPEDQQTLRDTAASFLEAVVDVLVQKTLRAASKANVKAVGVVGGVAANSRLRLRMKEACDSHGLGLSFPQGHYCTDNAAMVASVGAWSLEHNHDGDISMDARASCRLPSWKPNAEHAHVDENG